MKTSNLEPAMDAAENCLGGMNDEMLVTAAKSGDSSAFRELRERHANKLLRAAYRITGNWHDAEDALQDAFLSAFTHISGFEGRSSLSSWLTRITINSAYMIIRKRRARIEIPIEDTNEDSENWQRWEPRDPSDDPEKQLTRRERVEILRRAILRLPPTFRNVVELQHAGECSTKEIASELGISVPAVKSRLMRGKRALRASFLLEECGSL